ncbi:hypothetical protein PT2222_140325 [Paraburkholderia tropica]
MCAAKGMYIGLHNSAHRYMNIAWRLRKCKEYFVIVIENVIKLVLFCMMLSKVSENTKFNRNIVKLYDDIKLVFYCPNSEN